MKNICLVCILITLLAAPFPAAASDDDLIPAGSGLYDACALLAQRGYLPSGGPDATDLLGVTAGLRTEAEFRSLVRQAAAPARDSEAASALSFARRTLDIDDHSHSGNAGSSIGVLGALQAAAGGQTNEGGSVSGLNAQYGRIRALGGLGQAGEFTFSASSDYLRQASRLTSAAHDSALSGMDAPNAINGIDEAAVTLRGSRRFRMTAGYLRERWGSGYRGDLLIGDNAAPRFTLQIENPFSLGHGLGEFQYTQFESIYSQSGIRVYQGARRIEHALGDRASLSIEEAYVSNNFSRPTILALPFYAYQKLYFHNVDEPNQFNYLGNAGITVHPQGKGDPDRLYGQFLLDDIQAPSAIGLGNSVPRKIAYLVGVDHGFPRSGGQLVLEYARSDRETYSKFPPELAWFYGGVPQAHPIGPNGREIFVHFSRPLGYGLTAVVEGLRRGRTTNDFPAPSVRSLDIALGYHLGASESLGLRYSDYREDPFTGVALQAPANIGGASDGERLRRRTIAFSFLQFF